jgi:hypothetical protein
VIRDCRCNLALRMSSTVAAMALTKLSQYDQAAVKEILRIANTKQHKEICDRIQPPRQSLSR